MIIQKCNLRVRRFAGIIHSETPANACLKEDKRLDDAVSAIEQRRKQKQPG